jgi:hypothetical protein
MKYYFQKLTKFSKGSSVVDATVHNIHGFLWRDTCAPSSQLKSQFGEYRSYLYLDTSKLQEKFLSKLTKF